MARREENSKSSWLLSILLHAALIGVIFLTPARRLIFEEEIKEEPEITLRNEQLEKVVEKIREAEAESLADRVELLEQGAERMDDNQESFEELFEVFEETQVASAEPELLEAMERALELQEEILASTEDAVEANDHEALQANDKSVAELENAQEEIRHGLMLLQLDSDISEAQDEATAEQFAASREFREIVDADGALELLEKQRPPIEKRLNDSEIEVERQKKRLEAQQKKVDAVKANKSGSDPEKMKKRVASEEKRLGTIERQLERLEKRRDHQKNHLNSVDKQIENNLERRDGGMEKIVELQQNALKNQKKVIEDIRTALESPREAKEPEEEVTETEVPEKTVEELETKSIAELHSKAVETAERLTDDYRSIRAMQLAEIRNIPYAEAYENIESVMPKLEPIDLKLVTEAIRDPALVQAHKQEVQKVKGQVEGMIELTTRLLVEVEAAKAEAGTSMEQLPPTLEDIVASEGFDPDEATAEGEEAGQSRESYKEAVKVLSELAKEDEEQRHKDLAAAMKQIESNDEGDPQPLLSKVPTTPMPSQLKDLKPSFEDPAFVRKIGPGGEPVKYVFVDTWYTIGPFPNPSRTNLNKKFPPETVVDLDATYVGKDGRNLRWEWLQAQKAMVLPMHSEPYGIWYAYTEVDMDEARDLWVAIGSDDKANVWVNDLPIWISSDKLKGWRINEGFRKVHFRKGVNKVLFRVENGWKDVGFSFVIHAEETGDLVN